MRAQFDRAQSRPHALWPEIGHLPTAETPPPHQAWLYPPGSTTTHPPAPPAAEKSGFRPPFPGCANPRVSPIPRLPSVRAYPHDPVAAGPIFPPGAPAPMFLSVGGLPCAHSVAGAEPLANSSLSCNKNSLHPPPEWLGPQGSRPQSRLDQFPHRQIH